MNSLHVYFYEYQDVLQTLSTSSIIRRHLRAGARVILSLAPYIKEMCIT